MSFGVSRITAWLTQASGRAKSHPKQEGARDNLKDKKLKCKNKNCGIAALRRWLPQF